MADVDPPAKKDFFISYNKADREWAEWVAWHLEESGDYSVVIQAWDFGPGSNFVLEMDRAIQECERVLAVLSPDYLSSLFTKPEWAAYFAQDPTSEQRRIISVRVRECEMKGLLAPIVYADVVGKRENEAKSVLFDAVKLGRRKPQKAPGFPGRKISSKPRFPGALPEVWHVPHLRNPNFTEPGERLSEIRDALRSGKPAALTQALAGLGGVGKTQLAVEYAYRYAVDYTLVWWLRSELSTTLAADYAALATALELPEKNAAELPAVISAVREALRRQQDWLLVFDNANAMEEIRPFLPQGGGHILITSRNPSWRGVANPMRVEKWSIESSVDFLLKRTGQTNEAAAKEIADELDHLPLALEQAGAYIESAETTLEHYLVLFRERRLDLLKRGRPSTDYPNTVATTWDLAFTRLETESPSGVALLQLCAFFGPDAIPRDAIIAGAEHLPEALRDTVNDGLAFDDAVGAIRRYSLIDVSGESTLSMHRLVQAVVRDRLHLSARERWAGAAVELLLLAFPFNNDDVQTWKECDRLLPHSVVATDLAEALAVNTESVVLLLNQIGLYLRARGEYGKARETFERSLSIGEKVFGSDHPRMANSMNNLGAVLRVLGEFSKAKAVYESALRIAEKNLGPNHPTVGTFVNNLGIVLKELGDLSGAKAALERALEIDQKALGVDHPDVATDINNLGAVLQDMGDFAAAKAAYEDALKIVEAALGPDHPTVAACVSNVGSVLVALGDFPAAKAACARALRIDEGALGPEHPEVAIDLDNFGVVTGKLGDAAVARTAFERALRIFRKSLGEDHPKTRLVREHIAALPH
jgi:tetratricopeptide (TPR) repeat protein